MTRTEMRDIRLRRLAEKILCFDGKHNPKEKKEMEEILKGLDVKFDPTELHCGNGDLEKLREAFKECAGAS